MMKIMHSYGRLKSPRRQGKDVMMLMMMMNMVIMTTMMITTMMIMTMMMMTIGRLMSPSVEGQEETRHISSSAPDLPQL